MRHALFQFAFINQLISNGKLPFSSYLIMLKLPFVDLPSIPNYFTYSMFLALFKLSFINVIGCF